MNRWIFSADTKDEVLAKVLRFIDRLPEKIRYEISLKPYKPTRSGAQNRYLWGVVYPSILDSGQLEGWTKDDLHEFFLGEHFGWERLDGFGRPRLRPIRRSSRLNKMEFADYIAFIQQFAAERGIYVPDPDDEFEKAA